MHLSRLISATPFRLALLYAALFAGSVVSLFAIVYWTLNAFAQSQIRDSILAETQALVRASEAGSRDAVAELITQRLSRSRRQAFDYLLVDSLGRRRAGNLPVTEAAIGWRELDNDEQESDGQNEDEGVNVAYGVKMANGATLVVARHAEPFFELRESIIAAFSIGGAITVVLALVGGLVLSAAFLRRIEDVNRAAAHIMEGNLSERIPERGSDDEFDRLVRNLNAMLAMNEKLMAGLRQVSSDIAHDLRTPLARLRQGLEAARGESHPVEGYEAAIEHAIRQTDEILATFSALLRISQIEAGVQREGFAELDLSAIFTKIVEAYTAVAEDGGRTLSAAIAPAVRFRGEPELLTQLLANLVENAVRHTPPGTSIDVTLAATELGPIAVVADNGPGIPAEARDKVFQRFYRLEESRTTPGSGLGLALVAAIADLHGIEMTLADNAPGLRVTVDFSGRERHD